MPPHDNDLTPDGISRLIAQEVDRRIEEFLKRYMAGQLRGLLSTDGMLNAAALNGTLPATVEIDHANLINVTADQHHAKSHTHNGDGSGTVDHGALAGLSDDDHPQYALDTDLTTHAAASDPHTGYVKESEFDAKGDLLVGTADNTLSRLAVGSSGQVPTADPTAATGIRWTTPANIPASAQGTWLVSGGQVTWEQDYDYTVAAGVGYIDGILYSWAEQTVTLDAADPSDDRIDVIYVDNTSTADSITGTATTNPSEPVVDVSTQLKLALVTVEAGTTSPSVTTTEQIYAENAGGPTEWNWTTSGSGWTLGSTNNPRSGTKDIEGTTVATNNYAQGQKASGTVSVDDYEQFVGYIRFKNAWGGSRYLSLTLRNNGVQVGNQARIAHGYFGLDWTNTTTYQAIVIPMIQFGAAAGAVFNQIRIQSLASGGAAPNFYLDDITLRSGGVVNVGGDLTQDQADARYLRRSLNLSDLADAATARTNLGATHANLPDVDTDDSTSAIHHTLGPGSTQAAAGDHSHSITSLDNHEHFPPAVGNPPAAQGGLYSLMADPDGPIFIADTSTHDGFPGLTQLKDGRLIVVYRQGTTHSSDKGSIKYRLSSDMGRTWESAVDLYTDATYDARDSSITRLPSGRLMTTFQLYDYVGVTAIVDGGRVMYSDDDGETWSSPYTVNSAMTAWSDSAYGPPVVLPDGSLRMCCYGRDSGDSFESVSIFTSTDDGATWAGEVRIADGQNDSRQYAEPQVARLLDGTLYVTMRSDTGTDTIYASTSTDDGATWSAPAGKFTGSGRPALVRLCDNTLVCIFRRGAVSVGDCAYRVSTDGGSTWGSDQVIEAVAAGTLHMVYAAPLEVAGGVLAVAYAMERTSTTDADLRFQYLYRGNTISPLSGDPLFTLDHGTLTGLSDDDHTQYQLRSEQDAASGYPSLDGDGLVPFAELPVGTGSTEVAAGDHAHAASTGDGDHEHMVDQFTGDGSTTAFELTDEPLDPEAVVAFVAGSETAVTMSGTMNTTATFGSAPSAAARVIIMYPARAA